MGHRATPFVDEPKSETLMGHPFLCGWSGPAHPPARNPFLLLTVFARFGLHKDDLRYRGVRSCYPSYGYW